MPVEYKLEQDGAVVLAQASGVLSLDSFIALQKALSVDEKLQSPHKTLLDIRFVTDIQLTEQDLAKIAQSLTAGPKTLGAEKLAIVARDEQAFVLGDKYGIVEKDVEEDVIVFFHMEVARQWLGID
ncbi:hypothetical protein ACFLSG_01310 [Candidatus Bipolaricaulota bacterium]